MVKVDNFARSPEMCYATKDEFTGRVWSFSPCPRPPNQRGPASSASNTSQYSGSAWGSQPPAGGMLLPCCFAFLVGCRRVTRKAKSTPMTRHSYHERDYAFGQAMLKLRTSIGLTQAGLAALLGVSRRAVGEWEAGSNYPKAEHLQQLIELCVQQHIFAPGREEEEIRALWKTAHQRVLLDEAWLAAVLTRLPAASASVEEAECDCCGEGFSLSPFSFPHRPRRRLPTAEAEPAATPRVDWVGALDVSHFSGREVEVAELSAVDRAGALPPDGAPRHGGHRQEYAGLHARAPPGSPLRGRALALGA